MNPKKETTAGTRWRLDRPIPREISYYVAAILLCLVLLCWVMHLWSADFSIPFTYGVSGDGPSEGMAIHSAGDSLTAGAAVKGMIDNGWYMSNPFLGMPSGSYLYDFPSNGNLDMSIMKMISFVFPNWALTMNIYFFLTFPLTVVTTLFVLRKIKISPLPAIVGSLLFTFIPYHFFRGEAQPLLSTYFLIPLIVLVILWIFEDDFLLNQFKKASPGSSSPLLNRKNLFSIIICIGIAANSLYYPFFSCFLLLVAGACAAVLRKRWIPLLNSVILIGIIVSCIILYNIPTLLYQHDHGKNMEVAIRGPQESETFGLKIIQLLLPVSGHRIPLFAHISDVYNQSSPLVTENAFASLGVIGSIGFIILTIWILYQLFHMHPTSHNETLERLNQISALNLAAVLLATIGGFGTVFAYLILPQIRCYNRISVFVAFFSITTIALLMDLLVRRYSSSRTRKWIICGCIMSILFIGIYDQTSPSFVPDYGSTKQAFLNDGRFVEDIETRFPDDTMVFQLPYVPYPEPDLVYGMTVYDHIRPYLHSKNIRWSYGAMKGRDGDLWQRDVTNRPIEEMLQRLSFAGFNGVYVDSYGYEDNGVEVISSISSILNGTPIVSDNGRLYFFDMTQYNVHLESQFTPAEYEQQKNSILNTIEHIDK